MPEVEVAERCKPQDALARMDRLAGVAQAQEASALIPFVGFSGV